MCGVEYICDDTMRMVVSVWCWLHLRRYHEDGGQCVVLNTFATIP